MPRQQGKPFGTGVFPSNPTEVPWYVWRLFFIPTRKDCGSARHLGLFQRTCQSISQSDIWSTGLSSSLQGRAGFPLWRCINLHLCYKIIFLQFVLLVHDRSQVTKIRQPWNDTRSRNNFITYNFAEERLANICLSVIFWLLSQWTLTLCGVCTTAFILNFGGDRPGERWACLQCTSPYSLKDAC